MLTAEEAKIINNYPLYEPISLFSYMKDFIFQNPLNFPYSTLITSHIRTIKSENEKSLKDIFNENNIDSCIRKFFNDYYTYKEFCREVIINNQVHFTLIPMAALCLDYESASMKIFKLKNGLNLYLITICDNNVIVIDENLRHLIRISTKDTYDMIDMLSSKGNQIESIYELSESYLKKSHFRIYIGGEHSSESYKIITVASIICNCNLNHNEKIAKLIGEYNIFRNNKSIPSEYYIEKIAETHSYHEDELKDQSLIDTKVI